MVTTATATDFDTCAEVAAATEAAALEAFRADLAELDAAKRSLARALRAGNGSVRTEYDA